MIHGAVGCDASVSDDAVRWTPEQEQHARADALTELFGESVDVIHAYSRAQALADGALVEVPAQLEREAGFRVPVALTAAAWEDCVAWGGDGSGWQVPQEETGRLWDVLNMTRFAVRRSRGGGDRVAVELYRVPRGGRARQPQRVQLAAQAWARRSRGASSDDHGAGRGLTHGCPCWRRSCSRPAASAEGRGLCRF
ncbi:DUF6573 family protein [Streptomyces sp. NPDC059866]|uniref:DUF6573 family protein n=1 Tax=Streptomyces sp. NPDC059866 TaxID=3346978 RepID=UPI00366598E9